VRLTILPAIDLRGGKVVRLRQGDPARQTVFGDNPVAIARSWERAGAEWLHIVNLDGALGHSNATASASPATRASEHLSPNLQSLAEIRAATALPIQYGGGIRSLGDAEVVIRLGASRVVLGTVALERPEVLASVIGRFGAARVVAALDARDGKVSIHGWQSMSPIDVLTAADRVRALGALRVLYTDISRDGMLSGINVDATVALARNSGLRVIASGGVASLADIRALAARVEDGVEAVVIGQALYTGVLDLAEAIAAGAQQR
jgi:phosphoribosylformimino-5-aminoimidazole carboxamide ribotide isomerase